MEMQFTIEINGVKAVAKRGETILSVLQRSGIRVPTLCCMAGFSPTGSCRMCIVEVDGIKNLLPACSSPVEEWMQIRTHSPRVIRARKTIVELLLANHPDDCLYCDRAGTCELQKIASELNIRERKYHTRRPSVMIDRNCSSIERDPGKCILCERCIRVCDETIGVNAIEIIGRGSKSIIGTSLNKGLNQQSCIKCGQCIMVCPTNALKEKDHTGKVIDALNDPALYPVIQLSSTITVSIAEEFGLKTGKDLISRVTMALRKIGFKEIYDTSLGADINTMEMAARLVEKIKNKEKMPLFTSCCPSWVSYVEAFQPGIKTDLAAVKSPQQIMGTLIREYFKPAGEKKIFSVAVMPCTAKKQEADLDPAGDKEKNVNAVLTTRELFRLLRHYGLDLNAIDPGLTETGYGNRGSSGRLYGVSGGASESIIRSFYYMMTGQEINPMKITELRGTKGRKEFRLKIAKSTYTFVAINGLQYIKPLLDEISAGRNDVQLVEVMVCPGGCINGGGQRFGSDEKASRSRSRAIYDADEEEMIKVAHKNPAVTAVYAGLLGTPLSPECTELLYNDPKSGQG